MLKTVTRVGKEMLRTSTALVSFLVPIDQQQAMLEKAAMTWVVYKCMPYSAAVEYYISFIIANSHTLYIVLTILYHVFITQ